MARAGGAMKSKSGLMASVMVASIATMAGAQQPLEPVDISPNDGEVYYLINQHSGLQADSSPGGRDRVTPQPRSFSSSSQRWALARVGVSGWQIENVAAELCLTDDEEQVELRECRAGFTARWELLPAANGYYAIRNRATHRF